MPPIDPKIIKNKCLITIGIGSDGKIYLIAPNGAVFDPSKMPARNRKEVGPIKTSVSIPMSMSMATSAAADKYIEEEADFGFGLTCIVLNQQTNQYMGSCPKEQYP